MKIGLVVNPVAGMGGSVGLKGTDGPEILKEALRRGAREVAPYRAVSALFEIKKRGLDLEFLTASGDMGKKELDEAGLTSRIIQMVGPKTTREDTARVAESLIREGVDLILFAGGDGTARDLLSVLDATVPLVGIPAGVKMHSSVFAFTPEKAADAVAAFVDSRKVRDAEVMDVDEDAFRNGIVQARLYGIAKVPDDSASLQATKDAYHSQNSDEEAEDIGRYIAETMEDGIDYFLGPGTTTAAIANAIGIGKTILGVDVILDRKVVCEDALEQDLLKILSGGRPAKIVVSPIGAQGFFLGRGNQQISASVVRKVGKANVVVIATPTKLLGTPVLRVDTGDPDLDSSFRGRMRVVVGYGRRRLVSVE